MTFDDFIKFFIAPLLTIIFVFFLKILSRKKDEIRNEDKAVGLEILIGNISVLFIEIINSVQEATKTQSITLATRTLTMLYMIAMLSALSIALSFVIKKSGWRDDNTLKKWAVNIPNIIGVLTQSIVWMILTNKH